MQETPWLHWFRDLFLEQGVGPDWAVYLNAAIVLIVLLLVLFLVDFILRKSIVTVFRLFSDKTKTSFDDFLSESNFPRFVAHVIPVLIVRYTLGHLFEDLPVTRGISLTAVDVYTVILAALICRSVLRSLREYLKTKPLFNDKPLDSYVQVMMIIIWIIAMLVIAYRVSGESFVTLTSLGAVSALLLLIFKDTILGFIASIQITVNDIVRIGDWITFNRYGADGYVTEINLATVRVQNFDNTFTTIPTYSLISDSFQNWRGMQESAGRRIKRSLLIKQNSVRYLTDADLQELKKIQLITSYIEQRQKTHLDYNAQHGYDSSLIINGRQQTNLGVFRKYIDAYLHKNNAINKELFLMVRHLQPTPKGIPVEIYCFSYDKNWVNYEHIQADIFDHLIAAVKYFYLEIYEYPSGVDLKSED